MLQLLCKRDEKPQYAFANKTHTQIPKVSQGQLHQTGFNNYETGF